MVELTSRESYQHGRCSGPPPIARRFWQIHHRQRIRLWGVAFVLPTLLFFAVFKYGPMLWAIELSFNSYDMVSAPHFVGLDNYRALAADPIFRETLLNTFVYIAGSTILTTVIGLALALADQYRRSRGTPLHDGNVPYQPDADHRRLPGVALSAASLMAS